MKFRDNLTIALALIAFGLSIAQLIHPFGFVIHPGILLVIALLLALRYAMRWQAKRRGEILKEVPPRPLGLTDEDPEDR
ncbi:MAG TPA: hypothetical protein VKR43_20420 [Bryobacteraceae bacterium]|nr:hypothetical protein [Bryobacteraceae bacterium]